MIIFREMIFVQLFWNSFWDKSLSVSRCFVFPTLCGVVLFSLLCGTLYCFSRLVMVFVQFRLLDQLWYNGDSVNIFSVIKLHIWRHEHSKHPNIIEFIGLCIVLSYNMDVVNLFIYSSFLFLTNLYCMYFINLNKWISFIIIKNKIMMPTWVESNWRFIFKKINASQKFTTIK